MDRCKSTTFTVPRQTHSRGTVDTGKHCPTNPYRLTQAPSLCLLEHRMPFPSQTNTRRTGDVASRSAVTEGRTHTPILRQIRTSGLGLAVKRWDTKLCYLTNVGFESVEVFLHLSTTGYPYLPWPQASQQRQNPRQAQHSSRQKARSTRLPPPTLRAPSSRSATWKRHVPEKPRSAHRARPRTTAGRTGQKLAVSLREPTEQNSCTVRVGLTCYSDWCGALRVCHL